MKKAIVTITADVENGVPTNIDMDAKNVSLAILGIFLAYFIDNFKNELSKVNKGFVDFQMRLVKAYAESEE